MALPDRIDFHRLSNGQVRVTKFRRKPEQRRDIPIKSDTKPADFDLDGALDWCAENSYTVRRWYNGARAWLAPSPWVIRTREEMRRLRESWTREADQAMRRNPEKWHTEETRLSMDLAYEG